MDPKDQKHTPLPWEAGKAYGNQNGAYAVIFAPTKTGHFHSPRSAEAIGITEEEAKANAEFIALACNSHYGLVGALRFLCDAADTEPGMAIYKAHIQSARAALASADNH